MIKLLSCFCLLFSIAFYSSCQEAPKTTATINPINVDSLQKEAIANYSESPEASVELFKQIATYTRSQKAYKQAGTAHLNIAGLYEEQLQQIDSALIYSYASLQDWKQLNDTLQVANLKKYIGYLEGLNGNYNLGSQQIKEAILLFQSKN